MRFAASGSVRLFRLFGIGVYLNYWWFLAAGYFIYQYKADSHGNWLGGVALCLSLYGIVLAHEFGHQLACRQVGGKTRDIMLWPFGGIAFVTPPERPGAQLWSIVAGPLVNVVLVPLLTAALMLARHAGWVDSHPLLCDYLLNVWTINLVLLCFNLLPIYPLDGGQILRSLLWFILGRANSLLVTSIIGFVGVAGLIVVVVMDQAWWLGMMTLFILLNCWGGLKQALALGRIARLPRRSGYHCASCHASPPIGSFWRCSRCGGPFDFFASLGLCPHCQTQFHQTPCLDCGTTHHLRDWGAIELPPQPPQ